MSAAVVVNQRITHQMQGLSIIFAGAGEYGAPALRAMLDAGHRIVQVVTQPDRPAGRGRKLMATSIAQIAIERGLPLIRTTDINAQTLPPADILVVIAFGQKIAETVIHHPRLGSVNLHASRLPKYRGAAPIHAAILAGESVTGNSIIRLANRMDAGAVLAMSSVTIGELETAGELHDRLAVDGAALMLTILQDLAAGTAVETAQDESQASLARKLNRDSSKIDWSRPAELIARQIRGLFPWPGCRVRLIDDDAERVRATLVRARAIDESSRRKTIGGIDERGFVACGSGDIEIVELQPEGGRVMSLAAFKNGREWKPGWRLEST